MWVQDTLLQTPRYIRYWPESQPSIQTWQSELNRHCGPADLTSWKLSRKESQGEEEFYFYQQLFKNIPVDGAVMGVRKVEAKMASLHGLCLLKLSDSEALISPEQAIEKALSLYPAEKYKWEEAHEEAFIKEIRSDSSATWYPKAELVFAPRDFQVHPDNYALCYRFEIHSEQPLFAYKIYVNASNGEIHAVEDMIHIINSQGTAKTKYSDTQQITTDSLAGSFRLREVGRGNGVETYNLKKGTSYGAAVDFTDADNFWDNTNANQDEIATDAHWGAEKTYDYYFQKFGRNSYDGNGAKIRSYVHYSSNYNNAFWNGSVMTYGDGNGSVFYPLTCLDVCAHEVTHAVTTNTAALVYSYESGALNESFSDIFGNSIEKFAKPNQFNWRLGEEITPSGTGIRHMGSPDALWHSDTYKGTLWYSGAGDNGGVHTNSGVQNYWYYLLCEGGIGKNDLNDSFWVDSMGMLKAEQIAYRNLSVYLGKNSQYADARFFSIQAAVDLFGNCSPEVIATTNAWHAVGVGQRYDSGAVIADFAVDTFFCRTPVSVPFQNLSLNANKYKWDFGDGNGSTVSNPVHNYQNQGTFSVSLEAEGCFVNIKDTIFRLNVIEIDSTPDICRAVVMTKGKWTNSSICDGFVYDNGGEGKYEHLVRDTLTLSPSNADSIELTFLDFDYENKFDSVYIYDGSTPAATKIGGYTGSTLPNGGNRIVSSGGSLTLIHFSDPLENGRGFKASVKAYKPPLSLVAMPDTTVCYGQNIRVWVSPAGGSAVDYLFNWNGESTLDSFKILNVSRDTSFTVSLTDVCTGLGDTVAFNITVRSPLSLNVSPDTLICYGTSATLRANVTGGYATGYQFRWNQVAGGSTFITSPIADSSFQLIVSDGCSHFGDTASILVKVMPSLSLQLSADTLICSGGSANLRALASGGRSPLSLSWSHGLGTGANKSVNPLLHTTYTVQLTDGCSQPGILDSIRVMVRAPLSIILPADTLICNGQGLRIDAQLIGGDTANRMVLWNSAASGPFIVVAPVRDTLITAVASDNCSSPAAQDQIFIRVRSPLQVTLPANDTICHGESRNLQANGSGGNPSAYQFTWLNGLGSGNLISVNPATQTTYRVVLTDNCSTIPDTASTILFVRNPLLITAPIAFHICQGDTVKTSVSGSGGLSNSYSFSWSPGGLTGDQVSLTPLSTTWYTVTLNDGCSNYDADSILVNVKPSPLTDFYAQSSPLCNGKPLQFRNLTPSSPLDIYEWDFGDGNGSGALEPWHIYDEAGWYNVSLKITNNQGCSTTKTYDSLVEVVQMPFPKFSLPSLSLSIDQPLLEPVNQSLFAETYLWDFGNSDQSAEVSPKYQYTDTGHYKVNLQTFNRLGCDSSYSLDIWVKPILYMHIPNAFTPEDKNGNNDYFRPTFSGVQSMTVKVFNRWGAKVYESESLDAKWNGQDSDGDLLPPGAYIYHIRIIDMDRMTHTYRGSVHLMR